MIRQSSNFQLANEALNTYSSEDEQNAFCLGYAQGHGLACHNVPEIGMEYHTIYGKMTLKSQDDITTAQNIHFELCCEAEENSRCYTPWELIAKEINELNEDQFEEVWEAYEDGVYKAILHDVETYTLEDYGLIED